MAVELVTGHAGSAHVSGADVGSMHAGIVGTGAYALTDSPTLTMTNANTLSISPCDLMINGRHVKLTGTNTLTVQSGTQSGQRHDLVYVRYNMSADTSVETAELGIVTGTTSTSPVDPALPNDGSILDGGRTVDVAIARISLDGLTPTAEWLLSEISPLSDVEPVHERGYETLATGVTLFRDGKYRALQVTASATLNGSWATQTLATMDEADRPVTQICASATMSNRIVATTVRANTDGTIVAACNGSTSPGTSAQTVVANLAWVVMD